MSQRSSMRQTGGSIILQAKQAEKPGQHTFSRFVLPFSYKARSLSKQQVARTSLCYKIESDDASRIFRKKTERMKYFTRETADVLFNRAKRLVLGDAEKASDEESAYIGAWSESPWAQGVPMTLPDGTRIDLVMERPSLILFEWDGASKRRSVMQTGFLILDIRLKARDGREPILDDLLALNEFFRFIDRPYEKHYIDEDGGYCFRGLFAETPISFVKGDAKQGSDLTLQDDASQHYTDRWMELLELPVEIDGKYYGLVAAGDRDKAKNYLKAGEGDAGLLVYADNRAYVWSAAVLEKGVEGLQALARSPSTRAQDYGHWVRLLNVDKPERAPSKTHDLSSPFEREWAAERTYKRWEASGTWYGFSYHGGVMLSAPSLFVDHFATIYFDIVILLFYLRVTLFRFGDRLSEYAKEEGQLRYEGFKELREQFARFTILYQFPILSNHQQAIEMYTLAREQFDVAEIFDETKNEIHETHAFLEMDDSIKLSEAAVRLSRWGLPIAAGALAAGVFGMNIKDFPLLGSFTCQLITGGGDCRNLDVIFIFSIVFLAVLGTALMSHKGKEPR